MKLVRLTPALVFALLLAAFASAWIASRTAAPNDGFSGSTAVALWFLGFAFLAFALAAVAACITLVQRHQLTLREKLSGTLPLLVLVVVLTIAYLWLT